MIKQDIISRVAENAKMSEYEAKIAVDETILALKDALLEGNDIEIRGFGVFRIKVRRSRSVRDINNGIQYTYPAKKRITFKPSSTLNID